MDDPPARILVVEDEPRIASFVAKGLGNDGREVVVAEDGDVGLFLATHERFDVILLDVGLPGTSGLEVLRQIRQRHPSLPVLVLTGHDEPAAREACLAAGASAYLTKPFSFAELRAAIRERLG